MDKRGYDLKKNFTDEQISEDILKALKKLRYFQPTPVQQEVIPVMLSGKDATVEAQTGSGKTASYAIPLCEQVVWEENKPQALVLAPTRELALQIKEDIINIGRYKRIKATAVFGKASFKKQQLELKQKSHIVVGTPGRILDHLQKGTLHLEKLRTLILDEADEMLNMGFIDQMEEIMDFVPESRQTVLFSATLPEEIERMAQFYLNPDNKRIKVEAAEEKRPAIQQSFVKVAAEDKEKQLLNLLIMENPDSCMIFCNTKAAVNQLYTFLHKAGLPIDKLHGGMLQDDRFDVMKDFKEGRFRYLVATDVAARGIDIEQVTHVVNFDVPEEVESFIHRSGRTGRAGRAGSVLTLVEPDEEKEWQKTKAASGFTFDPIDLPSARVVKRHQRAFEAKMQQKMFVKKNKLLDKEIMKLYFNGGKKKKLRAVDFVGTISKIPTIQPEDIGIITIQETATFVEILNGKGPFVLEKMKDRKIKGKQLKVYKAKK